MMTGEAQKNEPTVGAWKREQRGRDDDEAYEHARSMLSRNVQSNTSSVRGCQPAAQHCLKGLCLKSTLQHRTTDIFWLTVSQRHLSIDFGCNGTYVRTLGGSVVTTGSSDPVCDVGHVLTGGPPNLYTIRKHARVRAQRHKHAHMDTCTDTHTDALAEAQKGQKPWVLPFFCPVVSLASKASSSHITKSCTHGQHASQFESPTCSTSTMAGKRKVAAVNDMSTM